MGDIQLIDSEKLRADLVRFNIPFAPHFIGTEDERVDTGTLDVFVDVDVMLNSKVGEPIKRRDSILIPLLPLLNNGYKVCVKDHYDEKDYWTKPEEQLDVTCFYTGDVSYVRDMDGDSTYSRYKIFYYDKQEMRFQRSQGDYFFFNPPYGLPIKDNHDFPIAFIAYKRIHIFFDIFHLGLKDLLQLFLRNLALTYLSMEDELKSLYRLYRDDFQQRKMAAFIAGIRKNKLDSYKFSVSNLITNIDRIENDLTNRYSELRDLSMQLDVCEKLENIDSVDEEAERLRSEFNMQVDFNDGSLFFDTEDIYIKGILIGKFRVSIYLKKGSILIRNITNPRGRHDHPHIRSGLICLGNIKREIRTLMAGHQYFEVARLCKQLLYFYTPSAAYINLKEWGQVKENIDSNAVEEVEDSNSTETVETIAMPS